MKVYGFFELQVIMKIKYIIIILLSVIFLSILPKASNAAGQPFAINWQQNDIKISQLQTLFQQNPSASLFNIKFPNGTTWSVDPTQKIGRAHV